MFLLIQFLHVYRFLFNYSCKYLIECFSMTVHRAHVFPVLTQSKNWRLSSMGYRCTTPPLRSPSFTLFVNLSEFFCNWNLFWARPESVTKRNQLTTTRTTIHVKLSYPCVVHEVNKRKCTQRTNHSLFACRASESFGCTEKTNAFVVLH